jgi:hypothetical protein
VELMPDAAQAAALRATLVRVNQAANGISEIAWGAQVFTPHALHMLAYRRIRAEFMLGATATVLAMGRVAAAYRLDRIGLHRFGYTVRLVTTLRLWRGRWGDRQSQSGRWMGGRRCRFGAGGGSGGNWSRGWVRAN